MRAAAARACCCITITQGLAGGAHAAAAAVRGRQVNIRLSQEEADLLCEKYRHEDMGEQVNYICFRCGSVLCTAQRSRSLPPAALSAAHVPAGLPVHASPHSHIVDPCLDAFETYV